MRVRGGTIPLPRASGISRARSAARRSTPPTRTWSLRNGGRDGSSCRPRNSRSGASTHPTGSPAPRSPAAAGLSLVGMRESPAAILSLEKVRVAFGDRPVLSDISFEVASGEFLCVVGPSGCGKTTLIRLLAGLLAPTAGAIAFGGRPLAGTSRDRAIIFQDYSKALLPWRTVAGNIALALEASGVAEPEKSRRVDALL